MAAVSQPKRKSHSISASPILWGALLTVGFFGLLEGGVLETLLGSDAHQFMMRYAAGHPVGYCEVAMFFVALAALVLKRGQIMGQLGRLRELLLGPIRQVVDRSLASRLAPAPEIVAGQLGARAALMGALSLATDHSSAFPAGATSVDLRVALG